jgi:hypothetical protein
VSFRQSIYGLGRSRRAVVLTLLISALGAALIWTLAHTDIAAFATIFVSGVVLVFGTIWATGPVTSQQIASQSPSGRSNLPTIALKQKWIAAALSRGASTSIRS